MNSHVNFEIGALTEGLPAAWELTSVWLGPRMQVKMRNELGSGLEDLTASRVVTFERLLLIRLAQTQRP